MFANKVTINIEDGVHTRIAAMIVQKASQIKHKYNLELYIKKYENSEPLAISMLALLSLKIVKGETVEILCNDDSLNGKKAIIELCDFITKKLDTKNSSMTNLDAILEENTIATEQILQNLPVGVIVIDANSNITTINSYGLKLIDKDSKEVIGKNITDIIPNSDLPSILKNSRIRYGDIKYVNNHMVIVNASPIISNGKIIGAVKIFQDISELVGIKELNEKLKSILETSHELICFVDENRKISYINPAYEKYFNIDNEDIVGKDLIEVSPKGFRMKSFNSKKKIENVVHQKGDISLISTIQPIFIEDSFKGVISISKPANEIKDLVKKLDNFEEELNYYKQELQRHTKLNSSFKSIIGSSGTLRECLIIADKASKSSSTVLIRGESGTGKELIANAIHNSSDRKNKPFIRVNCAAIPENLLESELFGYEKGSFTGANATKIGKFEICKDGTLFLDEIGDLPYPMQVKLLRALEEKEITRIGGHTPIKVNPRIISATHKDLKAMVEEGTFREDLFYRLNVVPISIPPLRDRGYDIIILSQYFLQHFNNVYNKNLKGFTKECENYLMNYSFPGNIRELRNLIEYAVIFEENNLVGVDTIMKKIGISRQERHQTLEEMVKAYEKKVIESQLHYFGDSLEAKRDIARNLDISIATLYRKLRS